MSAPAMAEGPSGNVSITNDYVWRGISQSFATPVVQGGLDWEKDKFSFGVWGSGIGFGGGTELDVYGAYDFGPVAVGLIYYAYPDSPVGIDFYEANVGGDLGPVSLMASYNFTDSLYYVEGSYSMPIGTASLDLHVGYGDGSYPLTGVAEYDASVGVSGTYGGVDLSAAYWTSPGDVGNEGKFIVAVGKSM
jgi:uncharacterized protein (TIGR02001 family)